MIPSQHLLSQFIWVRLSRYGSTKQLLLLQRQSGIEREEFAPSDLHMKHKLQKLNGFIYNYCASLIVHWCIKCFARFMAQRSEVPHHIVHKLPTVNREAKFRGKMHKWSSTKGRWIYTSNLKALGCTAKWIQFCIPLSDIKNFLEVDKTATWLIFQQKIGSFPVECNADFPFKGLGTRTSSAFYNHKLKAQGHEMLLHFFVKICVCFDIV